MCCCAIQRLCWASPSANSCSSKASSVIRPFKGRGHGSCSSTSRGGCSTGPDTSSTAARPTLEATTAAKGLRRSSHLVTARPTSVCWSCSSSAWPHWCSAAGMSAELVDHRHGEHEIVGDAGPPPTLSPTTGLAQTPATAATRARSVGRASTHGRPSRIIRRRTRRGEGCEARVQCGTAARQHRHTHQRHRYCLTPRPMTWLSSCLETLGGISPVAS